MSATIVMPANPHNGAGIPWLRELSECCPGQVGWLINGGGEVVDRDPSVIAAFVQAGGTWVDYCGYPMYYREHWSEGEPIEDDGGYSMVTWLDTLGETGFREFLISAGNLLFDHTFWSNREGFVYPRSLVLRNGKPPWVIGSTELPHTAKIFSAFAVQHESGGRYFYAYGVDGSGVTPGQYAQFMASVGAPVEPPEEPDEPGARINWLLALGAGLLVYWGLKKRG